MLSGHGLNKSAWASRGALSAYRMDSPSMVRVCDLIDWVSVVAIGMVLKVEDRLLVCHRVQSPPPEEIGCRESIQKCLEPERAPRSPGFRQRSAHLADLDEAANPERRRKRQRNSSHPGRLVFP